MRRNIVLIGLGAVLLAALAIAPLVLAPGAAATTTLAAEAVPADEQAGLIDAMRPSRPGRPVIAIVTLNAGTEVSDFLSAYGVLRRADVADVTVVAERAEPIRLFPSLSVEPQSTFEAFDTAHPGGADYIVVPAMEPDDDPAVLAWILAQRQKGARIVSICNGARTLAAAGLLDDRRATGHWSAIADLQKRQPGMQFVPDRRYVADDGIVTSTGISANVPVMVALVEAIGGRETAERVAGELGLANWDARHRSAQFELSGEHKKTFIRNTVSLWRHDEVGVPLAAGVDEVALGLMVDAYGRTAMSRVVAVAPGGQPVTSRHGLVIHPDRPLATAGVDIVLPPPPDAAPAMTLERELPRIADRYDPQTAAIVAQVMEYSWAPGEAR